MPDFTWMKFMIDALAIIGGVYSIYKMFKTRAEKKKDIGRINELVEEDQLPPGMQNKKIKPDEYLLWSINQLTRVLDRSMRSLQETLSQQKPPYVS